jgi:fructose-bisphosphate aldolase class I
MTGISREATARALVETGKGLLAADETVLTLTKRFEAVGIVSTPASRGAYREMFFTTPRIGEFLSGVILHDETIRQRGARGQSLTSLLVEQSVLPGIKVDTGTEPLAGAPGEQVTGGLDGLRERLKEYRALGARFAKWRAVIAVSETLPSLTCVHANAHALARYAALAQELGLVPIVEPEILMDGAHTIARCEQVTGTVLHAVFNALHDQRVVLEELLLKPNMVVSGSGCLTPAPVDDVAAATLRCLRRHVPAAVPGVVFLSGGQDPLMATMRLSAINQLRGPKPWALSFSYGRALQDEALRAWRGQPETVGAAQRTFRHRAKCVSAAALGQYLPSMERESAVA